MSGQKLNRIDQEMLALVIAYLVEAVLEDVWVAG
jgi:hypothetical protein